MGKRGKMAKIKAAFYSSLEQELANERTNERRLPIVLYSLLLVLCTPKPCL